MNSFDCPNVECLEPHKPKYECVCTCTCTCTCTCVCIHAFTLYLLECREPGDFPPPSSLPLSGFLEAHIDIVLEYEKLPLAGVPLLNLVNPIYIYINPCLCVPYWHINFFHSFITLYPDTDQVRSNGPT